MLKLEFTWSQPLNFFFLIFFSFISHNYFIFSPSTNSETTNSTIKRNMIDLQVTHLSSSFSVDLSFFARFVDFNVFSHLILTIFSRFLDCFKVEIEDFSIQWLHSFSSVCKFSIFLAQELFWSTVFLTWEWIIGTPAKRVMWYLQRMKDYILTYRKSNHLEMAGYSDFNFAGCLNSRKSTSDYVYMLVGGVGLWKSVKQTLLASSTVEA